ncbi:MAG: M48 family metallopeptidase [Rhodospirillaceae bacterium]
MEFPARFSDGQTSAVTEVTVRFWGDLLEIVESTGEEEIKTWRLDEIIVHDVLRSAQSVRLSSETDPECRLTVVDEAGIKALSQRLPKKSHTALRYVPKWRHIGAYTVLTIAVIVGLYLALPLLVVAGVNLVPQSWEDKIGRRAFSQFESMREKEQVNRVCLDRIQAMSDKIIDRIKTTNGLTQQFHLLVMQGKLVNAFAMPGGHLVLFEGLVKAASSPEEVAGVLGHEMGHEIKRHVAQAFFRALIVNHTLSLIFGTGFSADISTSLASRSYSRDAEREADELAVELLQKARIDTNGIRTFFEKLAEKEKGLVEKLEYFSTHPRSQDRADQVKTVSQPTIPVMPAEDWQRLRQFCGFDETK